MRLLEPEQPGPVWQVLLALGPELRVQQPERVLHLRNRLYLCPDPEGHRKLKR